MIDGLRHIYNPEREIQVGLFRVPVPKVDLGAFREAVANALVHRDYHRMGAVHVRMDDEGLTISDPGGLMDGVAGKQKTCSSG